MKNGSEMNRNLEADVSYLKVTHLIKQVTYKIISANHLEYQ